VRVHGDQEQTLNLLVVHAVMTDSLELSDVRFCVAEVNVFALTQMAIYGKSFGAAGNDAWNLIRLRGLDLVINHDLNASVMWLLCLMTGGFTGLCGALWASQQDDLNMPVVTVLCFATGFTISSVMLEVIEGGINALFVCYAEDPEILSRADPVVFSKIREGCCVENDFM